MTSGELRELLQKVRVVEAARMAGCPGISLQRYSRRQQPVPPHIAERLAPLREYRPMTPRELRAIIARAGGAHAVSRVVDVDGHTLERWLAARGRPTMAVTEQLRGLWVKCERTTTIRMTTRPVPGAAPMSTEELGRIVRMFGGLRRAADLVGCSRGSLQRYTSGRAPVAPIVAVALREAAERRSESDRQIASDLRARAAALLVPYERKRDLAGQPLYRNRQEMAACVDQIVAFVASAAHPVSPSEIGRQLAISKATLSWPLKVALRSGRLQREGQTWAVRYWATAPVAPVAIGQPVWRASPGCHKRTSETVRAEADRVVALLTERGPQQVWEICGILGIPDSHVRWTLRHAERRGLIEHVGHGGQRAVYAARRAVTP